MFRVFVQKISAVVELIVVVGFVEVKLIRIILKVMVHVLHLVSLGWLLSLGWLVWHHLRGLLLHHLQLFSLGATICFRLFTLPRPLSLSVKIGGLLDELVHCGLKS